MEPTPAKSSITKPSKIYEDGSQYQGQLNSDNQRHAYGVYVDAATGTKYTGWWKDDQREGTGTLEGPHSKFVGEWRRDSKWIGTETGIFEKYEGEWENNKYHGQGKLYQNAWPKYVQDKSTAFVLVYSGGWRNGKKHGKGVEYTGKINETTHYLAAEGEWKDGIRNGLFKDYNLSGDLVFEGLYQNGVRNGPGIEYQEYKYEAFWKDGKKNGFGKKYLRGQLQFEGHYEDGVEKNGTIYSDGEVSYKGSICGNNREGYGVFFCKKGEPFFEGEWKHNFQYLGISYWGYKGGGEFSRGLYRGSIIVDGIELGSPQRRIRSSFHEIRRLPNGDIFKLKDTVELLWIGKMTDKDSIVIGSFQGISPLAEPSILSRCEVMVRNKYRQTPRFFEEWDDKKLVSAAKYFADWTNDDIAQWIEHMLKNSWIAKMRQAKIHEMKQLVRENKWSGSLLMKANTTEKLKAIGVSNSFLRKAFLNLIIQHTTSKGFMFCLTCWQKCKRYKILSKSYQK